MNTTEQHAALMERRVNIGFVRPDLIDELIETEKLFDEPIVLAVPVGHKYTKLKSISLAKLFADPLICFPQVPEPSFGNFIVSVCREHGFEPNVVQHAGRTPDCIESGCWRHGAGSFAEFDSQNRQGGSCVYSFDRARA